MNSGERFKELARDTKHHLSYEEIQLAVGDFSISAAGVFLAAAGVERGKFFIYMLGGTLGQGYFTIGKDRWKSVRVKVGKEPAPDEELL